MAGYTKNFNLKLPSDIEFYDIEDFNENFEKIDQMAVKKGEGIGELTGGALSDRPEPGIAGRYYFAQDTGEIFLDTGEEWVLAAASQKELAAHKADYIHLPYSIADGTNNYTTLINGIASLVEGMSVKIKFTSANTGASTLNINGLGAIPIKKSNGNDLSAGNIKAGQILHLVYTGSVFQLLGEGGEYGTAQPNHVLEGITFGTEEGIITGTMPNRGAINNIITTQGGQIVIPEGYHNGSGIVKAQFANLIAENIKKGVNIGGVTGNLDEYSLSPGSRQTIDFGEIYTYSNTFTDVLTIRTNYSGKIRVTGSLSNYATEGDAYLRIYVNNTYTGIEHFYKRNSPSVSISQDISVTAGGTVEIKMKSSYNEYKAYCSNFKLGISNKPFASKQY
ncbi:hypothetical protein [Tepidimicrobium xylanilyticum]